MVKILEVKPCQTLRPLRPRYEDSELRRFNASSQRPFSPSSRICLGPMETAKANHRVIGVSFEICEITGNYLWNHSDMLIYFGYHRGLFRSSFIRFWTEWHLRGRSVTNFGWCHGQNWGSLPQLPWQGFTSCYISWAQTSNKCEMLLHPGLYLPMKTDCRSLVLKILVLRKWNSFDIDREMGPCMDHAWLCFQAASSALRCPACYCSQPTKTLIAVGGI